MGRENWRQNILDLIQNKTLTTNRNINSGSGSAWVQEWSTVFAADSVGHLAAACTRP